MLFEKLKSLSISQVDRLTSILFVFKSKKFLGIKVKWTRFTTSDLISFIYLILESHIFYDDNKFTNLSHFSFLLFFSCEVENISRGMSLVRTDLRRASFDWDSSLSFLSKVYLKMEVYKMAKHHT